MPATYIRIYLGLHRLQKKSEINTLLKKEKKLTFDEARKYGSRQIGPRTVEPHTVGPRTTGPQTVGPRGPTVHLQKTDSWAPDSLVCVCLCLFWIYSANN